jgi:hypothetical protein
MMQAYLDIAARHLTCLKLERTSADPIVERTNISPSPR